MDINVLKWFMAYSHGFESNDFTCMTE